MDKTTPQTTTALPVPPQQKGFGAVPGAEQAVFLALVALALLLLLPLTLDTSRLTRGSLRDAWERPRSVEVGLQRAAQFYDVATWGTHRRLDRVRTGFGVAVAVLCLGGAYAGRCVHAAPQPGGTALRFGGAGPIRARVVLARPGTTR